MASGGFTEKKNNIIYIILFFNESSLSREGIE